MGHAEEAVDSMGWGLEEDPLNLLYRHHWARGLRHAGRLQEAEVELRRILEVDADFPLALETLGAVCAQQGRDQDALTCIDLSSESCGRATGALLFRSGATSRALTLIEGLKSGKENGAPTGLAVFYAMCGEFDRAAEWAERAIEERYQEVVKALDSLLRRTPVWPALAKLMNLAE